MKTDREDGTRDSGLGTRKSKKRGRFAVACCPRVPGPGSRVPILLAAILLSSAAWADQYRSETRELETPPPEKKQQDPKQLLQMTTDPYAKAMILRDLAAQAAQNKDYAGAAKMLEQALGQNALSGIAAEQMKKDLSQLYLAQGNYTKIIPQLEAQVKAGNAPPETLAALGGAYLQQKRYKDALPLLQKAAAAVKNPDPSWRRALVAAMMGGGQEKSALPLLEQLLKDDPSQREDWMRIVALQLKYGTKERAQAAMEIASRLGFLETAEERLRLVTLTAQVGAPFEAGSLMQGWMQSGQLPANGANWRLLAGLWISARESTIAIPALQEAIEKSPSAELYQQMAQLAMDREEYAEASKALQKAIDLGARNGNTLMALGMARYQQADVDESLRAFRDAAQFPNAKKTSAEWIKYLESGKAREQALVAATERHHRDQEQARMSTRLLGGAVAFTASAAPTQSSAPGGGDPLTPIGAERPGNADNTIPPWTGGLAKSEVPAAFKPGGRYVDPYPNDRPLFTITPGNAPQYKDKLSKGHQALLLRYPHYQMPVYTTRRTVAYPQAIYDATQANIGKSKLLGSDALEGAHLGFPFPKPASGVEIMWNHRTRYRGDTVQQQSTQYVVTPGGAGQMLKQTERAYFRYGNVKDPVDIAQKNILLYYLTWFGTSKNDIDFVVLVHETANSIKDPRDIWVMPPKIPKMFRIPPVGYDQPFPGSQGIYFIDMVDMYNGAFDRYVWKLVGKRELYIPYNDYRLVDGRYKYAQLLTPYQFNPEGTRYELHRVWVIEATERGGKRHSFGKRVFYADEDSWNVVLVENYDHDDNLWRFQEGHLLPLYDVQAANTAPVVTYDFKTGNYFVNRLTSEDPPAQFDVKMDGNDFLPASVKNRYSR
jgi:tetratricopeptide (TPR) repeat protein